MAGNIDICFFFWELLTVSTQSEGYNLYEGSVYYSDVYSTELALVFPILYQLGDHSISQLILFSAVSSFSSSGFLMMFSLSHLQPGILI